MRSLFLLVAAALSAHAGALYNASGAFGAGAPNSIFTAPNATWSLTFTLEDQPALAGSSLHYFSPAYSNFAYLRNGIDLGLTPEITFFDASLAGMFSVFFDNDNHLAFTGPEMFTGPVTAPTMLNGSFTAINDGQYDGVYVGNAFVESLAGTSVTATPEPGGIVLMAGGIVAMLGLRRRRS